MARAAKVPSPLWRAVWFDLRHGLPIAVAVLRERFGLLGAAGILLRVVRRRLSADCLAEVPAGNLSAAEERLTRRQLRGVFLLDEVLERDFGLPVALRMEVLRPIVGGAGARFVAAGAAISANAWRRATDAGRERDARRALGHFPNAHAELKRVAPDALEFDVTYCRLAEACHGSGRGHLAPLFCHADAVYFDGRGGRPTLERAETIAAGEARCTFRLGVGSPDSE